MRCLILPVSSTRKYCKKSSAVISLVVVSSPIVGGCDSWNWLVEMSRSLALRSLFLHSLRIRPSFFTEGEKIDLRKDASLYTLTIEPEMPRLHSTCTLFPMQSSGQTTPLHCSWHESASSSTMMRSCNSSSSQNGHVHINPTLVRSSPARSPGLERLPAPIRSGNPVERKSRLHDTSYTIENMNPVSGTKYVCSPFHNTGRVIALFLQSLLLVTTRILSFHVSPATSPMLPAHAAL